MTSPTNPPRSATLDDVGGGVPFAEAAQRSEYDAMEEHYVEEARLRNELSRARIDNVNADRQMRQTYASRILRYLEYYSAGVGVLIVYAGFNLHGFQLPPEILATLVGSTAVAAIGLVGFIARGLFGAPSSNDLK